MSKVRLRDLKVNDYVYLIRQSDKAKLPYKVTYFKLEKGNPDKVWDLTLTDKHGGNQHYSFIDSNIKVELTDGYEAPCPTCGR